MGSKSALFGLVCQANSVWSLGYVLSMDARDNLSRNLLALMAKNGFSQGDMHRKCGIAQSTIGRIIRKTTAADIDTVSTIAEVFQLTAWQLLAPPFDPSNPPVLNQVSEQERQLYERLKAIFQEGNTPP
jgi:transcriptional regulator with XRE-family HTH domain